MRDGTGVAVAEQCSALRFMVSARFSVKEVESDALTVASLQLENWKGHIFMMNSRLSDYCTGVCDGYTLLDFAYTSLDPGYTSLSRRGLYALGEVCDGAMLRAPHHIPASDGIWVFCPRLVGLARISSHSGGGVLGQKPTKIRRRVGFCVGFVGFLGALIQSPSEGGVQRAQIWCQNVAVGSRWLGLARITACKFFPRRKNDEQESTPHPNPMGGAPSACESVSRSTKGSLRDQQTQARQQMVSPRETFASRNVVPDRSGESNDSAREYAHPNNQAGGRPASAVGRILVLKEGFRARMIQT